MPLIVILDDRATNRQIFSRLAASIEDGVTVRAFADPQAALVWLETNTPDLVVTDFKMPNMDGGSPAGSARSRTFPKCPSSSSPSTRSASSACGRWRPAPPIS
jgi:CheY-like chemotaxis protein